MDIRGIKEDFSPTVEFNDRMYGIYTNSPGIIEYFDGKLATVQISVRMKFIDNGVVKFLDPPLIPNVPVVLPCSVSEGVFITVPIKKGDPCMISFCQRGIDNVVQMGGIQNPPDADDSLFSRIRHHDMVDAICHPGLHCVPGVPPNWTMDGIEIRNREQTVYVRVKKDGIESKGVWNHTGHLNVIEGNITATGNAQKTVGGNIKADFDVYASMNPATPLKGPVRLSSHRHYAASDQVNPGSSRVGYVVENFE